LNATDNRRVYYAYSLQIYGTLREARERKFLREKFNNLICPNQDIGEFPGKMGFCLKMVRWSDLVVVSEYEGHIGMGVYCEIKEAFELYTVKGVKIVDKNDIKVKYAKVILGDKVKTKRKTDLTNGDRLSRPSRK
jgi:hypothetical protein